MILLLDLDFLLATPQFFSACCSAVQAVLFAYELPLLWMDFELIPKFLRSYSEASPKLFRSYSEASPKLFRSYSEVSPKFLRSFIAILLFIIRRGLSEKIHTK